MARFVPNPAFKAELQASPEFQKGTQQITVQVAESIELAAEAFRGTGHFVRNVKTRKNHVHLEPHFAHLSEFGSANNPPQANVRRGVKAAGLRFEDSRAALT